MKITEIRYNYRWYSDGNESGEDYNMHIVGKNGVIEIIDQSTYKQGYLVKFENGTAQRIFNPNRIFYAAE